MKGKKNSYTLHKDDSKHGLKHIGRLFFRLLNSNLIFIYLKNNYHNNAAFRREFMVIKRNLKRFLIRSVGGYEAFKVILLTVLLILAFLAVIYIVLENLNKGLHISNFFRQHHFYSIFLLLFQKSEIKNK